tara:strand:+ start:26 stop:340 length:315 start_codon:yes stop_codon:yes gene_type:complete
LGLTFFGLTSNAAPQARLNLFSQINQIVFHGKGGYDYSTVYNMPIWLRKYTFQEIQNWYNEEKKAHEAASKGKGKQTLVDPSGKVNVPAFEKATKQFKGKTGYK